MTQKETPRPGGSGNGADAVNITQQVKFSAPPDETPRRDPRNGRIRYTQLYLDAAKARIGVLSAASTGAWFRIFLAMLERQGPLPDDDQTLAAIAMVSAREWANIRSEFERHQVFDVIDGLWHDQLADDRIAYFQKVSARNARNIRNRWQSVDGGKLEDES